jgi:hypothetical protein
MNKESELLQSVELEKSPNIPSAYFNGFSLAIGAGDVSMTLMLGPQKIMQLNMSYTVAKTLTQKLAGLIDILEQKTGNQIMSTDEVNAALSKSQSDERTEE